jgi:hypothetical protein
MLAFQLSFLTPFGGLVALAALLPLAAHGVSSARNARGRAALLLAPPGPDRSGIALSLVPLLLGLAAAQPALRTHVRVGTRTDAQALFVFDISGSMDASAGPSAPSRLAQAQAAAIRLRAGIADVPSGVVTLTTQLLPRLLPTADRATFDSTVDDVVEIEQPPPPALQYGALGTSFGPLAYLRTQGYYAQSARKRLVVLLTDGESAPYAPQATAAAIVSPAASSFGFESRPEPPLELAIVRVGSPSDRIYGPNGVVDPAYRPDPQGAATASTLATLTGGAAFTTASLGRAAHELRALLGKGTELNRGTRVRTTSIARYLALIAAGLVAIVLWKRNLARE